MYLSQWLFRRTKTESGDISNPYNLHKALWKAFPGRENDKRDFIYRADKTDAGRCVIMLSATQPVTTADLKLVRPIAELHPAFTAGARYKFSLRANPVKRLSEQRCRVPLVKEEDLLSWLARKLEGSATLIEAVPLTRNNLDFCKGDKWGKLVSVDFRGVLRCDSPANLLSLVESGIGAGKAFGCGLLLLKRE